MLNYAYFQNVFQLKWLKYDETNVFRKENDVGNFKLWQLINRGTLLNLSRRKISDQKFK